VHRATPRFWRRFEQLPEPVQRVARRNFRLLADNAAHPSLRFKKVGAFWSARVGRDYRALAIEEDGDFFWFWIGTHDEYNRLIG
jgi:hypothetical protein